MNKKCTIVMGLAIGVACFSTLAFAAHEVCIDCHKAVSPGLVADWQSSTHSKEDVTCSTCHGDKHKKAKDSKLAQLPDEQVCAG